MVTYKIDSCDPVRLVAPRQMPNPLHDAVLGDALIPTLGEPDNTISVFQGRLGVLGGRDAPAQVFVGSAPRVVVAVCVGRDAGSALFVVVA